jgi:hypothetical protein
MATKIKTKKLVYEATKVSVKQSDQVDTATLGRVTVENVYAARKKSGLGRVTLRLADGRLGDYPPSVINAIWQ